MGATNSVIDEGDDISICIRARSFVSGVMPYRLNQVEGALNALLFGRSTTAHHRIDEQPPLIFKNQIKRLLEIDRVRVRSSSETPAFFDHLPIGTGSDAQYDEFGTFCLATALELLRFGFKQREVVGKIASLRPKLEKAYERTSRIVQARGSTYQILVPEGPKVNGETPGRFVFLVIDPIEGAAQSNGNDQDSSPTAGSAVCQGWGDLQRYLKRRMPSSVRSAHVVDLSELVIRTNELLPLRQPVRRGRS